MIFQQHLYLAFLIKTILVSAAVLILLLGSATIYSSPGAHGPNGEHIEIAQNNTASLRPQFEAFSESFELVGEVFDDVLLVYLHDFQTNVPVQYADIELEVDGLSVNASFDESLNYYRSENQELLALFNSPGEYEITLTILTEDNGDLLFANLMTPAISSQLNDKQHGLEDDHHHFPWWAIALAIVCLALGFFVGRKHQGEKV